jgi:hypothetical protein
MNEDAAINALYTSYPIRGGKRRHLGNFLTVVVKAAGVDAALALIEKFGGSRVYIPVKPKDNHPIVRIGGRAAADAIADAYGSSVLIFPKRGFEDRRLRVLSALRNGASVNEAVKASGLSFRQVQRIKAELRGSLKRRPRNE